MTTVGGAVFGGAAAAAGGGNPGQIAAGAILGAVGGFWGATGGILQWFNAGALSVIGAAGLSSRTDGTPPPIVVR